MHRSSTKQRAKKLRLVGHSYTEISRKLQVPKSTLHTWLFGVQLSDTAQARIQKRRNEPAIQSLIKRNKMKTHIARQRAKNNHQQGQSMIKNINNQELLIIGAALYWGEGYKRALVNKSGRKLTHHPVSLSNTDSKLVRIFIEFLRTCFKIRDEEIEISLHLYDHINEQVALRFWQNATGLPPTCFSRVYYNVSISSQRQKKYNRLPYGTAQVRVNSTPLYHQIMGLIESIGLNLPAYPNVNA